MLCLLSPSLQCRLQPEPHDRIRNQDLDPDQRVESVRAVSLTQSSRSLHHHIWSKRDTSDSISRDELYIARKGMSSFSTQTCTESRIFIMVRLPSKSTIRRPSAVVAKLQTFPTCSKPGIMIWIELAVACTAFWIAFYKTRSMCQHSHGAIHLWLQHLAVWRAQQTIQFVSGFHFPIRSVSVLGRIGGVARFKLLGCKLPDQTHHHQCAEDSKRWKEPRDRPARAWLAPDDAGLIGNACSMCSILPDGVIVTSRLITHDLWKSWVANRI